MDRRLSPTAVRRVATPRFFPDDAIARFGADSDAAIVMRSATLAADTALDGVLVGTVDGEAVPANSLLVSVASTTGDIALYTGRAGVANSNMVFQVDNSLARVVINPIAGDWDFVAETDNNTNGLFVDAGNNSVSFGGVAVVGAAASFNNTTGRVLTTSVGAQVHVPTQTTTFSNASGTVAIGAPMFLGIQTWLGDNATLTITQPATLYIAGVPVANTNVSFSNTALALWVDAGAARFDGDITTGETTIALLNATAITVNFAGAATSLVIGGATTIIYLNDTANANMTAGLTLNQGTNSNEILALKGTDVAHGRTGVQETDTFLSLRQVEAGAGGLQFLVTSDATLSAGSYSIIISTRSRIDAATAKTTSALGIVALECIQHDGSNADANVVADGNLMVIRGRTAGAIATRFIFDAEGSAHGDVEWIAFDDVDDLIAMANLQSHMMSRRLTPARYGANPLAYHREWFEQVGIIGRDSWHIEDRRYDLGRFQERAMVNWGRLSMLHHGAILQVADRVSILEAELDALKGRMSLVGR